jgi:hypothetical protein
MLGALLHRGACEIRIIFIKRSRATRVLTRHTHRTHELRGVEVVAACFLARTQATEVCMLTLKTRVICIAI